MRVTYKSRVVTARSRSDGYRLTSWKRRRHELTGLAADKDSPSSYTGKNCCGIATYCRQPGRDLEGCLDLWRFQHITSETWTPKQVGVSPLSS